MKGGKREGAGRPAPLGRKVHVGLKLTPDAKLFCQQHEDGYVHLENLLRRSKAFRAWLSRQAKLRQ